MQKSILRGPIVKTLFILGWPIMLTHFFQIAYNLVDTYWLGRLGVNEVAAPSLAWPMVFLLISIAGGLGVAGVALVSQYAGAKDEKQVKKSAGQVMSLLAIVGTVVSIIGVLGSDVILQFIAPEQAVFDLASPYIKLIFSSMPFMFIIMVYSFILRGWGDTRTPMYISAFSVGLNIILDPFLILGIEGVFPGLGVTGAGIATLISRSIGGLVCLYLLFRGKKTLTISVSDLKIEKEKARQIFRIGIPSSIGQAMVAFGFVVMVMLVTQMGTPVLATYGIGTRVINIVFLIIGGLTGAAVTMIGQSLGAGDKDRAGKVLYRTIAATFLILLACSTVFFVFSDQIIGVFLDDKQVIDEGRRFFLIFGMSVCLFGVYSSSLSAFQAAGHTVPTMVLGITRLWLMRVPFAFVLAFVLDYGVVGIWMGMALSNLTSAIVGLVWVSLGKWKEGVIKRPPGVGVGEI
jgi:putative MATE family efflux protein